MAHSDGGKSKLNDLLMCPICLDPLTDPRTLACIHSFCTGCLKQLRPTFRLELICPVCKRMTPLPQNGVEGLPLDYRIEQIRDVLKTIPSPSDAEYVSPPMSPLSPLPSVQACDACKAQQGAGACAGLPPPPAVGHCVECYMWYCDSCLTKHGNSALFSGHSVIRNEDSPSNSMTVLCTQHKLQAVKFVCKTCHSLLCTVCVMSHDSSHQMAQADQSAAEQCRKMLKLEFTQMHTTMSIVNRKIKCLETIKEHQQSTLFAMQSLIKQRANDIIEKVKVEEMCLMEEAKRKFDNRLKDQGVIHLTEMRYFCKALETLTAEIGLAINKYPAPKCLMEFDDLMSRIKQLKDTSLPSVGVNDARCKRTFRFVPASSDLESVIGSLQECTVEDDLTSPADNASSSDDMSMFLSPNDVVSGPLRKRTASILNALSPSRKDARLGRLKKSGRLTAQPLMTEGAVGGGSRSSLSVIRNVLSDISDEGEGAVASGGAAAAAGTSESLQLNFSPLPSLPWSPDAMEVVDRQTSSVSSINDLIASVIAPASSVTSPGDGELFRRPRREHRFFPSASDARRNRVNSDDSDDSISPFTQRHGRRFIGNLITARRASASAVTHERDRVDSSLSSLISSPVTLGSADGMELFMRNVTTSSSPVQPSNPTSLSQLLCDRPSLTAARRSSSPVPGTTPASDLWRDVKPKWKVEVTSGQSNRLMSPVTSVSINSEGCVVVASGHQRLTVFSRTGEVLKEYTDVEARCVVYLPNGDLACTDKQMSCVRVYPVGTEEPIFWGGARLRNPAGLDYMNTLNLVVSDLSSKSVYVMRSPTDVKVIIGERIGRDLQLGEPNYLTVDRITNRILVSDGLDKCIKIFSEMGLFLNRVNLPPVSFCGYNSKLAPSRPAGLCVDLMGNILVCDVFNHRISKISPEGRFIEHVITRNNEVINPCDVAVDRDEGVIAVVESYPGQIESPHNTLKYFTLVQ